MNERARHLFHVEHLVRGKHWPRVVSAARERGLDDVSYENLVSMHADEVAS